MARYNNRGSNGRYGEPYVGAFSDEERRCQVLQSASNRLADEVAHQMLDRDLIRRQIKLANQEHPDLGGPNDPRLRHGQDGDVPEIVDRMVQAGQFAHRFRSQNRG